MALVAALIYSELSRQRSHGASVATAAWASVYVDVALSMIYAALAYFIFRGARWARTVTAIFLTVTVALGLAATAASGSAAGLVGLLPQAALLALLFHRDVRQWCS
jgi:hypothetical protein